MSTDRDTTRIVRSWLEEGATALPDRVLDAVLDQLPATSQRRASWPARRFSEMNNALKLAIAAAAVVVVAVVGIILMPRSGGVGGPGPSATSNPTQTLSPTQIPSPTKDPSVNFTGDYVAGTTYVIENPCQRPISDSAYCVAERMTFTIPAAGWYTPLEAWRIGKNNPGGGSDLFDLYVTPLFVGNIYTGGCQWHGTALDPPVGPNVDDLATALFAQAGPGASPPASVTVGGYAGKKVELSNPEDLDVSATCEGDRAEDDGKIGRFVFLGGTGAHPYTHGKGQHHTFYIIDVNGTRQVIDAMYLPETSAADRAEQDQIVASIRFETAAPSPSASP